MIRVVLIILGLSMMMSCANGPVTPAQYIAYINDSDNGLISEQQAGNYTIAIQYQPAEFIAISKAGPDNITYQLLATAKEEEGELEYYLLRIGSIDKKTDALSLGTIDQQQVQDRVSYLMSQISEDIILVEGNDTMSCVLHHYERNYHLAHYYQVMLTFERKNKSDSARSDRRIVFNDKALGVGKMHFQISNKDIQNIPPIIL